MAPAVLRNLAVMLLAAAALVVVFILYVHAVSPGLTTLVGALLIAVAIDEAPLNFVFKVVAVSVVFLPVVYADGENAAEAAAVAAAATALAATAAAALTRLASSKAKRAKPLKPWDGLLLIVVALMRSME